MTVRVSQDALDAALDAITAMVDAGEDEGFVSFYEGGRPASVEARPTGKLLAFIGFSKPAFRQSSKGRADSFSLSSTNAVDTGKIGFARVSDSSGRPVFDCSVGIEGSEAEIVLNTLDTFKGGPVILDSFTLRV